ncbi:MAG: metal ABC transporter substrate-binding protein [Candidatus Omnitrophica bacterium]|nr:metal ABC transporter substrate-binding protein [Candidatus Omnitrophota bacterium]
MVNLLDKIRHFIEKSFLLFCVSNCLSISYVEAKPIIVVTTSDIASIVQEIATDSVKLHCLIPPQSCPGHFDLTVKEAQLLQQATLIIGHRFEEKTILEKLRSLTGKDKALTTVIALDVEGSWMVPEVYLKATEKISQVLSAYWPEKADFFKNNSKRYISLIKHRSLQLLNKLRKNYPQESKVIVNNMQKDLLAWLGFKIVASYGRPEEITPKTLMQLIDLAKKEKVKIVVDNLQSSANSVNPISSSVGIPRVVLSNFPKEVNGKFSYLGTLEENIQSLIEAIQK